jgi:thymidine kinase
MNNDIIMTGYLKVILGCMFSGKTTELIKEYRRHKACDLRCCFINHSIDDRYDSGTQVTKTHNNTIIENDKSCDKLIEIFGEANLIHEEYDVFFINEGQFFQDLYLWVDWLVNSKNKKVYVCGLDGDFQRRKFGSILDIIPLCDDVIKIKAICKICKNQDGIFTFRLSNEKEQRVIGCDNYTALCRNCYNLRKNPEEIV